MHFIRTTATALLLGAALAGAADKFAWSQDPPGKLAAKDVPMFVCFGYDDNGRATGMNWFNDLVRAKKNPAGTGNPKTFDGAPVRATYFITAAYGDTGAVSETGESGEAVLEAWKTAYKDGHEIGNHTWDHPHGSGFDVSTWKDQMKRANDFLVANVGVPLAEIKGFRTPFLEYSPNTLQAAQEMGFAYDVSIEFGFTGWVPIPPDSGYWNGMTDPDTHMKLWWPHTLDEGSPPGNASKGNPKAPGMWEVPVYTYLKDGDAGEVTGFDFNLWKVSTKEQFLATMKHNFNLRRTGNRNPLTINAHTDYYTEHNADANTEFTLADWKARREAIEEFLAYALAFPETRVVPYKDMLAWMKNPVALSGIPGAVGPSPALRAAALSARLTRASLELSLPSAGRFSVSLSDLRGRAVSTLSGEFAAGKAAAGKAILPFNRPVDAGVYVLSIGDGAQRIQQRVVLAP